MKTISLVLWIAGVALGVRHITSVAPQDGGGAASPSRVASSCTARKPLPKNHRLAIGDFDCSSDANSTYAGRYLTSAIKKGDQAALDNFQTQPIVKPGDGEELFLLPLAAQPAAANMLNAGTRVDVWCGGATPRIDAASTLAMLCPSATAATTECHAVLAVPRGLRASLVALSDCQILIRTPPTDTK
jgi:hypothetical protein